MSTRRLAWCVAWTALLACAGCARERAATCPAGDIQLAYDGDSRGRGALRLSVTPDGVAEASLVLEQPAALGKLSFSKPDQAPAQVRVPATGRCSAGQVRLVLGSASGMISDRFVLKGGVLEGTLTPELAKAAFGYWQIDVHDTVSDQPRKMQGFWQQVKDAEVIAPKAVAAVAPVPDQAITAAAQPTRVEERAASAR